jgi:hypothetical protein
MSFMRLAAASFAGRPSRPAFLNQRIGSYPLQLAACLTLKLFSRDEGLSRSMIKTKNRETSFGRADFHRFGSRLNMGFVC